VKRRGSKRSWMRPPNARMRCSRPRARVIKTENAAIAAALRSAGAPSGPSVAGIQSQMEGTAKTQAAGAGAQAQRDLDAYRKQLEAQDMAQITAAQHTLAARADRTYRAKADELNATEASLSLLLANADAAERLSLRSAFELGDGRRCPRRCEQSAGRLDRKEADLLAAARNRDAQTLAGCRAAARRYRDRPAQAGRADSSRSVARFRERAASCRRNSRRQRSADRDVAERRRKSARNLPPALRGASRSSTPTIRGVPERCESDDRRLPEDAVGSHRRYAQLTGTDAAATQSAHWKSVRFRRSATTSTGRWLPKSTVK